MMIITFSETTCVIFLTAINSSLITLFTNISKTGANFHVSLMINLGIYCNVFLIHIKLLKDKTI